jgi:23S rRNA (adenine2503-C2)-methyltransferase
MKIKKNLKVPTGNILIAKGSKGKYLEFLSIGDYGKSKNVKADFMGLKEHINGVPDGKIMPLEEKWVITISTQYGCSMGCVFCDVPKVGPGINVSYDDLINQVIEALKIHPEVEATKRLNIHYARMGEPTFNHDVIMSAKMIRKHIFPYIGRSLVHPVVSTMMPWNNHNLEKFLQDWCEVKNYDYRGDAGLQLSINSTDDEQRKYMFGGNSLNLKRIAEICKDLPQPKGRKYTLNFALADDYVVDGYKLSNLFSTNKFMVKITPLHKTRSCVDNSIATSKGYKEYTPYEKIEENLKEWGFDVLVFIPSLEEDLGRITCGNAILSGTIPFDDYLNNTEDGKKYLKYFK